MKKITQLLLILPFILFSCSSDDDSDDTKSDDAAKPEFAMTATINGQSFKANNPFGTNLYSSTNLWDYYPLEDFVMLQGRQGGVLGNPEINIWLKRTKLAVGTYGISTDHNDPTSHAIDLTDISTDDFEYTKEGTLTITEINTKTKIIKGTFSFTTSSTYFDQIDTNNTVTNGTFYYQYEEIK
ncbi:hypothetical protein [Flavobacterium aquicola]|uniref:Uncharacterized protein n=1 Tax=Flavobacterium aquicola TaxID=1682742 RepID=A0A3E0EE91_9FLAO|nr:hypothetical protein [Flavobacterium aquicola]REG96491.1 hypothetical protein C8P67_109140 [Flavobacterium aquicola]